MNKYTITMSPRCVLFALVALAPGAIHAQKLTEDNPPIAVTNIPAPLPPPDYTSISNFVGPWQLNAWSLEDGKRTATGWNGLMRIEKDGKISGRIIVGMFPADRKRSTYKEYTITASKLFAPLKKVGQFVYTTVKKDERWVSMTNSNGSGQKTINYKAVFDVRTSRNTNTVYQADFYLKTSQGSVEGKGWARIGVLSGSSVLKDGETGATRTNSNETRMMEKIIAGRLWGPQKQIGDFRAYEASDSYLPEIPGMPGSIDVWWGTQVGDRPTDVWDGPQGIGYPVPAPPDEDGPPGFGLSAGDGDF